MNDRFRGHGLGRILLRQALIAIHEAGATEVNVKTGPANFAALSLYRREGFIPNDLFWAFRLRQE